MKKENLIKYYLFIPLVLYAIYNILLNNLHINGLIHIIFMSIIILLNAIFMIINRKKLKCKILVFFIYLVMLLTPNNAMQLYFLLSNIIILGIFGIIETLGMKIFASILVGLIICVESLGFSIFLVLALLGLFDPGYDKEYAGRSTVLTCENNTIAYDFSLAAFGSYDYYMAREYKIIDLGNILSITWVDQRKEIGRSEFENLVNKDSCTGGSGYWT